jgi:plastocyanin
MDRTLKAIALVGLVSVLLAACSGGQATSQPASQPGAASSEARVTIKGFAFDPAELTVTVGTTVTWTNEDAAAHTISSDDKLWDSGRLSQGGTYSRVFDQTGSFSYHCAIHSSMAGTIIVVE